MRKWIIAALAAAFFVGGCATTDTPPENATPDAAAAAATTTPASGGATTSGVSTSGISGTATTGAGAGSAAGSGSATVPPKVGVLNKRSVYFDYDSFAVKDEFRPTIEAHAKFIQANKNARVILQGNTDERGTREYNIALGQKRADAVKKLMQLFGANEAQIETVSFGKEKPKAEGHDEAAWAQNRRVDIVYVGE